MPRERARGYSLGCRSEQAHHGSEWLDEKGREDEMFSNRRKQNRRADSPSIGQDEAGDRWSNENRRIKRDVRDRSDMDCASRSMLLLLRRGTARVGLRLRAVVE